MHKWSDLPIVVTEYVQKQRLVDIDDLMNEVADRTLELFDLMGSL